MGLIFAQGTKTLLSYKKTQPKKKRKKKTKTHTQRSKKHQKQNHKGIYIYIYMCVCVCVCVYETNKFDIRDFWEAVLGWRLSHTLKSHYSWIHGYSLTKQKSDFHGYLLG